MPDAAANAGGGDSTLRQGVDDREQRRRQDRRRSTRARPARINRLTVSVVMDEAVAGNLNQQQMRDLDRAPRSAWTRPAATTSRSPRMPFDTTAADAAAADMEAAREAEASEQMWSMIRTGGIAAGIALVVLLVWLRSRRQVEVEEDYEPLELTDDMLAELDRLRIQSTREELGPRSTPAAMELEAAERQKVRGEISTMVSERPDEVAAMLRGWLRENKS